MAELYISTDIETDGPIPGKHSMLSLGSAAFTPSSDIISTFTCNFKQLPSATPHQNTMEWWDNYPDEWQATRSNLVEPIDGITNYFNWLSSLPGRLVFVGYPAAFDFMFVYWYLINFVGKSPFAHSALDIKSYAMATFKTEYRKSSQVYIEKYLKISTNHTHIALEDAIRQGKLFCNLLKYNEHQSQGT